MKNKAWKATDVGMVAVAAVLLGWVGGIAYSNSSTADDDHDAAQSMTVSNQDDHHSNDAEPEGVHAHDTVDVTDQAKRPTVKLRADEDEKGGWNLRLMTTNFTFTPQLVGGNDTIGEGHAHLWVDGVKLTRLYGPDYYLAALEPGDHEVTVTLNTNSHKDYVVDNELVADTITVTQAAE
jgi:hypothetical protein